MVSRRDALKCNPELRRRQLSAPLRCSIDGALGEVNLIAGSHYNGSFLAHGDMASPTGQCLLMGGLDDDLYDRHGREAATD